MFKKVSEGEIMPEYHPSGEIANNILTIIWKLEIMDCFTAQRYMRKQLTYWRIQE
jgi:hypothetical protein